MIIHYKGLVEKEIGGKTIFFKFNMAAFTLLNDLQGVSLEEFSAQIKKPRFSTLTNFLFAGAETAYQMDSKNCDVNGSRTFTQFDASEWLNEIGIGSEGAGGLFAKAFEVPESKNDQPLKKQGKVNSKTS